MFIHSSRALCRPLDYRTGLRLRWSRWSSGHLSFGVKPSTARISSHLSTVVFATRCYLPQKYFAIRQLTKNRGWIKRRWPCCLETQNARWRAFGVFIICLWLAGTKPIERFMTKAKSQLPCDPRVIRALRARQNYNSLRENYYLTYYFPTSSYVAEITHPFAMADRGS